MLHISRCRGTVDMALLRGYMGVIGIGERPLIILATNVLQDIDAFADRRN